MNEILSGQLEILARNELMIKAIKTLFEERIEKEKPIIEITDDDKMLGEKYRAYEQSKNLLNGFLIDMEIYNTNKTKSDNFNKSK